MLLMVAKSRHHWMAALPGARDGLQGALFNLWTSNAKHRNHPPNTTHVDPTPPLEARAVAGGSVDQLLWLGKEAVGRVGLWEGDAAPALCAATPEVAPSGPSTCPHHPTFLFCSTPADVVT